MLRTQFLEAQLRQGRLDAKTLRSDTELCHLATGTMTLVYKLELYLGGGTHAANPVPRSTTAPGAARCQDPPIGHRIVPPGDRDYDPSVQAGALPWRWHACCEPSSSKHNCARGGSMPRPSDRTPNCATWRPGL